MTSSAAGFVPSTDRLLRRGRRALAAMFLANGFIMGAWAPQIPLLLPRHNIGEATMGLLILGFGLGSVVAMAFAGRMIRRFGSVGVLTAFAVALIPVMPLIVLAPVVPVLALVLAVFGAAAGTMDVAMNANAVEIERDMKRAIMSSSHGFWSLGGFLGGSLGGVLIGQFGALGQAAVVSVVLLGLIAVAAPRLWRKSMPAQTHETQKTPLFPREARVWLLGLTALLCMTPEGAIMDWSALYLTRELGLAESGSGMGFALFAGMMAVMRFAGDAIRNRFGAMRTLRVSALLASAMLVLASVAPSPGYALLAFAIAGLGLANTVPILFSAAGNLPGMSPGAGLATVTMIGYAGILVAPSTIGIIAEHAGFRMTWAGLAVCLLIVASQAFRVRGADTAA